jgi:hypothetical protein
MLRTIAILLAIMLAGCARIHYARMRGDPAPTVTISIIEFTPPPGTPALYDSIQADSIIYLPAGKRFSAWVKADGRNGVGSLYVEAKVGGTITEGATIQDHIDNMGTVAASLVILGVDGSGNPGNIPIFFELTTGQSGSLTARAAAPDLTTKQIVLNLVTQCPCPDGSVFDRQCDCGCLSQTDPALPPQYSDYFDQPVCGTMCCKSGYQCSSSQQTCGLPSQSVCESGAICLDPRFPVCRGNTCFPF